MRSPLRPHHCDEGDGRRSWPPAELWMQPYSGEHAEEPAGAAVQGLQEVTASREAKGPQAGQATTGPRAGSAGESARKGRMRRFRRGTPTTQSWIAQQNHRGADPDAIAPCDDCDGVQGVDPPSDGPQGPRAWTGKPSR